MIRAEKGEGLRRCRWAMLWTAVLVTAALTMTAGCVSKSRFNQLEGDLEACQSRADALADRVEEQAEAAVVTDTFYDGLVTAMQGEIASSQITIQQMQSGVNLNLPAAVLFPSGSADVSEAGAEVLRKVADQLKNVPYQTIVAGFTDNVPIGGVLAEKYPSNWELAAARASHVVCLLQEAGVPGAQLLVVSFGANDPVASNDTPEGRQANRRIEIRLRPVEVYE